MINLANLDQTALREFCVSIGEKPFRGTQIFQWIHRYRVQDFDLMTNLSKDCRTKLKTNAIIHFPEIVLEKLSEDGTVKWMIALEDGNYIETVFIPEKGRGTLCISSQVGCVLNCSFCSTGKQGFNRNLSTFEIIGQLWLATKTLQEKIQPQAKEPYPYFPKITNVVMMGMGEPLFNFDAVVQALSIMRDENAYGLSRRRVTLSTAGVVPGIVKLKEAADVSLALSLHATNNSLRNILVPLNKKYPLEVLIPTLKEYLKPLPKHHITIEYVMLKGVNDSIQHAKELITLLSGLPCKINLIPFNPHPGTEYVCSDAAQILAFRTVILKAGIICTLRKTRGQDIDAACGQLVGKVMDRSNRAQRWQVKILS